MPAASDTVGKTCIPELVEEEEEEEEEEGACVLTVSGPRETHRADGTRLRVAQQRGLPQTSETKEQKPCHHHNII
jgi:hypothetical protein